VPASIVLLTDFGFSEYVGVMKGVLAIHAPEARVIDLCHDVSPQGIREGAWLLAEAYRWFPRGAIFLCVVDPGVGSERRAVAIQSENYFFVGPDNGLLYPSATRDGVVRAVERTPPAGASCSFHGRDVFAPAAAQLANGRPLEALGPPVADLVSLHFHREGREGEIVRIDRFGNCVTNLPPVPGKTEYGARIEVGRLPARLPFFARYQDAPEGALFLIENSYGTLEIALKNGSAASVVQTLSGSRVTLA